MADKKCENSKCENASPTFYFNKNNPDGLDNRCKECKKREKGRPTNSRRTQRGSLQLAHEIRRLWISTDISYRALCDKYGFDVYNILRNKNWHDPNYIRPTKKMGRK